MIPHGDPRCECTKCRLWRAEHASAWIATCGGRTLHFAKADGWEVLPVQYEIPAYLKAHKGPPQE